MFDSGISASSLIAGLKNEIDVAIPISNRSYVDSLNSLEQLLYTEIIKEQRFIVYAQMGQNQNSRIISLPYTTSDAKPVEFEDIYTVFDGRGRQLKKTTLVTGKILPHCWHRLGNSLVCKTDSSSHLEIIYFVRPALKTVDENDVVGTGNVMLPVEFIDLAKAKLRGDAYKIANEDALAAKWLNDYNVLLETFKEWVEQKRPHFGM